VECKIRRVNQRTRGKTCTKVVRSSTHVSKQRHRFGYQLSLLSLLLLLSVLAATVRQEAASCCGRSVLLFDFRCRKTRRLRGTSTLFAFGLFVLATLFTSLLALHLLDGDQCNKESKDHDDIVVPLHCKEHTRGAGGGGGLRGCGERRLWRSEVMERGYGARLWSEVMERGYGVNEVAMRRTSHKKQPQP
jgi:hypothetical protein